MKIFCVLFLILGQVSFAESNPLCEAQLAPFPRQLQPRETFDALVDWFYQEIIQRRGAPGLVVGVSGTDSITVFLAAAKAFARAGRPERAAAIHFGDPNAPDWFQSEILPWLREQAPGATILVDHSIDARRDGLRWGALREWSILEDVYTGVMRKPEDRFWVVGTRNATEDALGTYSNDSTAVSVQPILHLWKSEVLTLCHFLNVPKVALDKSCETDCVCGRDQIAALNIPEIDAILMARQGKLATSYIESTIPHNLRVELEVYVERKLQETVFKREIPHSAHADVVHSSLPEPLQVKSIRDLTSQLPRLLRHGDPNVIVEFIMRSFNSEILPETLILFRMPGLGLNQKQILAQKVFNRPDLSIAEAKSLADLSGRIGSYGFSFSQWRFLTQRYGETPSLAEQFGMRRLHRNNDLENEGWGPGFVWQNDEWYLEYRRAYILISKADGYTLLLRNNSFHFGRDRLPYPVYLSANSWSHAKLENLGPGDLSFFERWQDVSLQQLKGVRELLNKLDEFNQQVADWVTNHGKFEEFRDRSTVPVYKGWVIGADPTWWPETRPAPLNRGVLMSSPEGDLP